jgi:hypothetical protein
VNAIIRHNGESYRYDGIEPDVYKVTIGMESLVLVDVGGVTIELTKDDLKKIAEVSK